ncbi:unnamed protein product [Mytilus edulis]|uniref:Uncharacterized protein n=1 Tax=Mytilus edulis TaxID=6550 RepID=A0A8S3V588_MYTED|nr:unnamed protein product [Mytilus edulis]
MRNHLAEDILNKDMLHLMQVYKESQKKNDTLNATIELIKHTSIIISNFREPRPIIDADDHRLAENQEVLDWFIHWEKSVINDHTITNKQKHLISYQTRQDIVSCIMGFDELCKYKLKNSHASIIARRVNSDVVENMFCQQRTLHNGANTSPTYLGHCKPVNSVILDNMLFQKNLMQEV